MKFLASALAATIAAAALVMTAPAGAGPRQRLLPGHHRRRHQVWRSSGSPDTYGVLLDFDPGETATVRLRVDSATTRYAVDFDDVGHIGNNVVRARRYFVLPEGEKVVAAWVESTGLTPTSRMECPVTRPYAADEPAPVNPAAVAAIQTDTRSLRDSFSTKTPTVQPKSFGAATAASCAQPYAPPRAVLPVQPDPLPAARAVHASGTTVVHSVDLGETSTVVGAVVVRSSGYAPLDRAALAAAQKSSYRTESFACRPVASTYQFTVTFGS